MKGSKHSKLGNRKGKPTYRTPSRIRNDVLRKTRTRVKKP